MKFAPLGQVIGSYYGVSESAVLGLDRQDDIQFISLMRAVNNTLPDFPVMNKSFIVVTVYDSEGRIKAYNTAHSPNATARARVTQLTTKDITSQVLLTFPLNGYVWSPWPRFENELGDIWVVYAWEDKGNGFPVAYPQFKSIYY